MSRKIKKLTLKQALDLVPFYFINISERVQAQNTTINERLQLIRLMKANGISYDVMATITGYNRKTLIIWVRKYWEGDVPYNKRVVKMYMNRMRILIRNVQSQLNYLYEALERPMNYKEASQFIDRLRKSSLELRKSSIDIGIEEYEAYFNKYLVDKHESKQKDEPEDS